MSLRKQIGREEFDYATLMAALSSYANPHAKITTLLRKGEIVRVKKGLYVFGENSCQRPYSRELLANLIYGPSMVSLDHALSHHGLIPERVEHVTSVTSGRGKRFDTPIGTFVYRPTHQAAFHLGMTQQSQGDVSFLIATPERALADKIREDRTAHIRTIGDVESYFGDLRLDLHSLLGLDLHHFQQLARALRSAKLSVASKYLAQLQREMSHS